MECKVIRTNQAPAAIGPYSQGIAVAPWVFVSGQLGIQPASGELVSSDFKSQTRQALENVRQIVLAAGSDLHHVMAVDVFLTDMKKFAEFNEVYAEFYSEHQPARAVVAVSSLPKNAQVEIKCVAYCGLD